VLLGFKKLVLYKLLLVKLGKKLFRNVLVSVEDSLESLVGSHRVLFEKSLSKVLNPISFLD
jgi:hypothetical protein